ncbi:hypothetical protein NC653_036982 [Populus alba x Populus x berolinensis]|uniref:Uncharacterized protein n=1 Tax=Populus alba x Populus x berolinensis TaxID=444605 RepID=A0AAD6LMK7_9ROSI|nr:hypothetical protein NC653_036982 [Populus alba x Populus x berolinensis]
MRLRSGTKREQRRCLKRGLWCWICKRWSWSREGKFRKSLEIEKLHSLLYENFTPFRTMREKEHEKNMSEAQPLEKET